MRRALGAVALLVLTAGVASAASEPGWNLFRQDQASPRDAVTRALRTNVNVGAVVLTCERGVVQLQLHPSTDGPLLPSGASPEQMKDDPRADLTIDGRSFPVAIAFSDEHAVVSDSGERRFAALSSGLLDALEAGRTLQLRLDLVREAAGEPASFDGDLRIDLQAGAGSAALASVRRHCRGR
jgi:hypothetical protein